MVGVLIGRQGKTIQSISTNTGASLTISRKPDLPNRVLIAAETEDTIERAKQEISRIIVSSFLSIGVRQDMMTDDV